MDYSYLLSHLLVETTGEYIGGVVDLYQSNCGGGDPPVHPLGYRESSQRSTYLERLWEGAW